MWQGKGKVKGKIKAEWKEAKNKTRRGKQKSKKKNQEFAAVMQPTKKLMIHEGQLMVVFSQTRNYNSFQISQGQIWWAFFLPSTLQIRARFSTPNNNI